MFFHPEKCEVIREASKKKLLNSVYKISEYRVLKTVEDKRCLFLYQSKKC